MGLFTKKDPCAICGGKVKALFPWKIQGQLVCNECHGVTDIPDHVEKSMNLEDFRAYMAFRDENKLLKDRFQITQKIDFGLLDTKFMIDVPNRLLCMDKHLNKTIFEGKHITAFVIREDSMPLFEGSAAGLRRYVSAVPDRVLAMAPQIAQYRMQMELQRNAERMDNDRDDRPRPPRPNIDLPEPFQNFYVEIFFDHPYWDVFTADMGGPTFDNELPDANDYLLRYNNDIATMEQLAYGLMDIAFPGTSEELIDPFNPVAASPAAAAPAAAVDAVEEIQRFKALLDQGIITEEEFAAKKRQLLGI